jgi:hypothetical protein
MSSKYLLPLNFFKPMLDIMPHSLYITFDYIMMIWECQLIKIEKRVKKEAQNDERREGSPATRRGALLQR